MPTPSGEWLVPPQPLAHPCRLPRITHRDAGREWQCECGSVWTISRKAWLTDDPQRQAAYLNTPQGAQEMTGQLSLVDLDTLPAGVMPDFAPPGDSITKVAQHSETCAHRMGTGMCSCEVRKAL